MPTVAELAAALEAEVEGDTSLVVTGAAELEWTGTLDPLSGIWARNEVAA